MCLLAQSCLTLCDPVDCSPPVSSVHGISQARILDWVVIFFSRGSSQPREIERGSPALQADSLPSEPPGKIDDVIYHGKTQMNFPVNPMSSRQFTMFPPDTGPHLQVFPSPQLLCSFRLPHVSPRPWCQLLTGLPDQSGLPAHHHSGVLGSATSLLHSKTVCSSPLP